MLDSRPDWKRDQDDAELMHQFNLSISKRKIYLHSSYDSEDGDEPGTDWRMANTFIKNLSILENSSDEGIEIHQMNMGGDEDSGYAIYDAIKACSCPITIFTHGIAASMGSIIPQAADHRVTMPNCFWLIHKGTSGIGHRSRTEAKQWAKWEEYSDRRMFNIYAEAIGHAEHWAGKDHSSVANSIAKTLVGRGDWIMNAWQAVDYGFCDEVLE